MHSAWSHTGAYQQLTAVYQSGRITADIYHYLSAYFVKIYFETHEIVFQHSKGSFHLRFSGKVKIWHIGVTSMGNVHKCIILTFPDPPCQPGQIFLVQNGLYMCPTYSTTCFMLNSHLLGVF